MTAAWVSESATAASATAATAVFPVPTSRATTRALSHGFCHPVFSSGVTIAFKSATPGTFEGELSLTVNNPTQPRVVLPLRAYTPDELHLIFRHEMIHICRGDSVSKFFLTFCTALCWFNPLMWRAMRNSAEDMELSCDESVLQEADSATRRESASATFALI